MDNLTIGMGVKHQERHGVRDRARKIVEEWTDERLGEIVEIEGDRCRVKWLVCNGRILNTLNPSTGRRTWIRSSQLQICKGVQEEFWLAQSPYDRNDLLIWPISGYVGDAEELACDVANNPDDEAYENEILTQVRLPTEDELKILNDEDFDAANFPHQVHEYEGKKYIII